MHCVDIIVAAQERAGLARIQTAGSGDHAQHGMVADVVTVGEMGGEEGLGDLGRSTALAGPADEAMRIDAAGRSADPVEAERNALRVADIGDGGVQAAGPVLAAEFADDVVRPGHPDAGHIGVEQERAPGKVEQQVRSPAHGPEQTAHPEIAPRANEIVHDLDLQTCLGGGKAIHGSILRKLDPGVICFPPCQN